MPSSTTIKKKEFLSSMKAFMDDNDSLHLSIGPIQSSDVSNELNSTMSAYTQADSLLRLLLRVQPIQEELIEFTLQKIVSIVASESCNTENTHDDVNMPMVLLNHLRWCDIIYDSTSLISHLMDAVQILPTTMQIEVISSIPGLTNESTSDMNSLVHDLQNLSESHQELVPCVLEAVSNLCLATDSEAFNSMVSYGIQLLNSADVSQLPAISRFLLDCAASPGPEVLNFQSIIVSILKTAFLANPHLYASLLMVLKGGREAESDDNTFLEPCPVDMWVIYALSESAKYRSKLHTFLIKQVESGVMTYNTIQRSIKESPIAVESIFPSILCLGQTLLASSRIGKASQLAHKLGVWLYYSLYSGISSASCRQEVIAALVVHAGAPNEKEAMCAFRVFDAISTVERDAILGGADGGGSNKASLRTFLPFIKSLLEDIQSLSQLQQWILFRVLFQCSLVSPGIRASASSAHVLEMIASAPIDDIMILLKKYAATMSSRQRKIAVIGQLAYIVEEAIVLNALGITRSPAIESSSTIDPSQLDPPPPLPCIERLKKLLASFSDDTASMGFLIEELARVADTRGYVDCAVSSPYTISDSELLTYLSDTMEDRIYTFIGGIDDEDAGSGNIDADVANKMACGKYYDMNESLSSAYVKVFDTVYADSTAQSMDKKRAPIMSQVLHAVCACQRATVGHLTDIGLLLGMSIELPLQIICESLHRAVEWVRSILNSFSDTSVLPNSENWKLVTRVNHLISLENDLYSHCQRNPEYISHIAPNAHVGTYNPATGKRITNKASGSSKSQRCQLPPVGQLLVLGDIVKLFDDILRPLSSNVSIVLGFGVKPLLYNPSISVTQSTQHTESLPETTSATHSETLTVKLEDGSVLRLLQHTADSMELFLNNSADPTVGLLNNDSSAVSSPFMSYLQRLYQTEVFQPLGVVLNRMVRSLISDCNMEENEEEMDDVCDPLEAQSNLHQIIKIISQVAKSHEVFEEFRAVDTPGSPEERPTPLFINIIRDICGLYSTSSVLDDAVQAIQSMFIMLRGMAGRFMAMCGPGRGGLRHLEGALMLSVEVVCLMDKLQERCSANLGDGTLGSHIVSNLVTTSVLSRSISDLCDQMLQYDWHSNDSVEKVPYGPKNVGVLVQMHIKHAMEPLVRVRALVDDVIPELKELRFNEPTTNYATLSIASFVHYMHPLLQSLAGLWKRACVSEQGVCDDPDALVSIVHCFSSLIMLTKCPSQVDGSGVGCGFDKRNVLCVALKEGRIFLEQFIRTSKGLHQLFAQDQQLVINMLTTLQKSTRQLQSLASHGKRTRDKVMSAEGPRLKKVLETLIYRMKDMASDNYCLGAVWVGNLKHRRIDGTEIRDDESESSQSSESDNPDSRDSDDEAYSNDDDNASENQETEQRRTTPVRLQNDDEDEVPKSDVSQLLFGERPSNNMGVKRPLHVSSSIGSAHKRRIVVDDEEDEDT